MTRMIATLGLALLLVGIGAPVTLPAQSQADIELRRAIETETVKGDLKKAIDQYRKLADGKNREVAAQALLRMARVYELQGDAEARKVYERIIAKFSEQRDAVEKAQAQLRASSKKPTALAHSRVWDVTADSPRQHDFDATEGSVSADGRYLCFTVGLEEGRSDRRYLAVHDVITGIDRILRNAPKPDGGEGCSFSPSGDLIAYSWHEEPDRPNSWEVRVVGLADNASPRTLLKDSSKWFGTPAWSPDGRSIAVQAILGNAAEGRRETILVGVQDRSTRVLPSPGGWRMFFSPDGRYLALDRRSDDSTEQHDVFVLSMDGNREVNVTEFGSNDTVMGWSPDSSRVLFASDRSKSTGLYAVSITQGERQGAPTLLRADIGRVAPMGVTSSGALHYHATSGGASSFLETVQCDPAAGRCFGIPVPLGAAGGRILSSSPDGRYLAYLGPGTPSTPALLMIRSMESGATREVRGVEWATAVSWAPDNRTLAVNTLTQRLSLVDAERAQVRELGRGMGPISGLAWSRDQRTLFYRRDLSANRGGDKAVALLARDVESGTEREIFRRPTTSAFNAWALSKDGQTIWAMVTEGATRNSDLLTVPLVGGEPRVIASRPAMGGVNVSPDGRFIATSSRDGGAKTTAVILIPTAGGEPRELIRVTDPAEVGKVMWAPDSRSVYFRRRASRTESRAELWRAALDDGEARKVEGSVELDMGLPVALSPDGRQLAFIRGDGGEQVKREVWKLENFLPTAAAQR